MVENQLEVEVSIDVEVDSDEIKQQIAESLEEAAADILPDDGSDDSVMGFDEMYEWAHEKDSGVIDATGMVDDIDELSDDEELLYTAFVEEWNGVDIPDGWEVEPFGGGVFFRKAENVNSIDPEEWYISGFLNEREQLEDTVAVTATLCGENIPHGRGGETYHYYFDTDTDAFESVYGDPPPITTGWGGFNGDDLAAIIEANL